MYEPTIVDQVPALRAQLADAERRRDACRAGVSALVAQVQSRGQAPSRAAVEQLRAEREQARADVDRLQGLLGIAAEEDAYAAAAARTHPSGFPAGEGQDGRNQLLGGTREIAVADGRVTAGRAEGPVWMREDGRPAAVARGARMADSPVVQEMISRDQARPVTEQYSGIGSYVRALSTTGSSGIIPTLWSSSIIDRARNVAQVINAGAEIMAMDSKVLQIGRLTADPVPVWLAEGGTRTGSDPTFDSVQLVARTLTCMTVASLEFLQDAVGADQLVEEAIGKAMGLEIDRAAIFSGVAAGADVTASGIVASPPGPLGILGNLLANQSANVLGSQANGTAITAATPYAELLNLYFTTVKLNEQPTAILMNASMLGKYSGLVDTLYQPIRKPDVLANVPWLLTNQLPTVTQGTGTLMNDIVCGDFRQVLIGNRLDMTVRLDQRYAELGQVGILATFRGDVVLARPKAMAVWRYLGGV